MNNRSVMIKNPLSVISIFAGIAEISGTLVLPHISNDNQYLFIWFLMLFPSTLVVIFFITLNWNYKVLYAPSDFNDEVNFMNLQRANSTEIYEKIQEELADEEKQEKYLSIDNEQSINLDLYEAKKFLDKSELRFTTGRISTKEEREKQKEIIISINKLRMMETRFLEDVLFDKLQKELDTEIERDIKLDNGKHKFMVDGLIKRGNNLTAIEIRRMNKNTLSANMKEIFYRKYNDLFNSLTDLEKSKFSLIFAIATEDDPNEMKEYLKNLLSRLQFEFKTRIFTVDELSNEQNNNLKTS